MAVLNYVAIIVAAVASMAIGWLWYSPMLFGKQWVKMMGFKKADMRKMQKKAGQSFAGGFVASAVMAYVLATFLSYLQATGVQAGATVGFWVWLGFIAPVMLGSVLWEGKPVKLYLLNASHWFVTTVVMAAIIAAW